jgi:catechol 2,3-dioxygenase-like lactoylglutathione lyase family enzyme
MANKLLFCLISILLGKNLFAQIDSSKIEKAHILGINHVGMNVKNLKKSISFYQNVFGLKASETSTYRKQLRKYANLNKKTALIYGPNANLEISQFDQKGDDDIMPFQGPGITHVCYQVPTIKPVYSKFQPNSATIFSRGNKPIDLGGYGIYYTYVHDPDKILFENEQMDKPHFEEDTWIGHVAIACTNIDNMVDFYTKFLNKKTHRRSEVLKDNPKLDAIGNVDNIRLKGAWFRTENMVFEFWEYQHPKPIVKTENRPFNAIGYSFIAFEVENAQYEYKRLKKLGMNILQKPIKTNDKTEFKLRDPEGNLLLIQEIKGENSLRNKKKLTEK